MSSRGLKWASAEYNSETLQPEQSFLIAHLSKRITIFPKLGYMADLREVKSSLSGEKGKFVGFIRKGS